MTRARDIADFGSVSARLDTVGGSEGALSNRNIVINGAFQVAQRSTSSTTANYSTVDRWKNNMPTLYTFSQSTDAPNGYSFSMKADCTSTGTDTTTIFEHRIEAQNLVQTGFGTSDAKSLTLSFWIKAFQTGTFTVELYNPTGTPDRQISKSYTVDSSGVWEYKTITFPPDTSQGFNSNNALGLYLFFWFSAASSFKSGTLNSDAWATATNGDRVNSGIPNLCSSTNNYVQITGVQLEVGTEATPFEHRSYRDELARCQRYFCQPFDGVATHSAMGVGRGAGGGSVVVWSLITPVPMRATPSMTSSGSYYITDSNSRTIATPTSVQISQFSPNSNNMLGNYAFSSSVCDDDRVNMVGANTAVKITLDAEL